MKINTENKNLVRDTNSMALLNINHKAITKDLQYKQRLMKEQETADRINTIQDEVKEIKDQITKILEILSRGH